MGATIKIEMDVNELDEIIEYLTIRSCSSSWEEARKCHIWAGVLRGEMVVALQDEYEDRLEKLTEEEGDIVYIEDFVNE